MIESPVQAADLRKQDFSLLLDPPDIGPDNPVRRPVITARMSARPAIMQVCSRLPPASRKAGMPGSRKVWLQIGAAMAVKGDLQPTSTVGLLKINCRSL